MIITFHTATIEIIAAMVACITISIRIFMIRYISIRISIFIITTKWRALLNLFNAGDQIVHIARQLIHKIALFSDERYKFTLGHTIIETRWRSCHGWKIGKNNNNVLSLSTKRNQVVVVKVEYKIRSGLPLSYNCSYQSQTGAKLN